MKNKMSKQQFIIGQLKAENARLLSRLHNVHHIDKEVLVRFDEAHELYVPQFVAELYAKMIDDKWKREGDIFNLNEQRDAALELADRLDRFADYRETDVGASEYEQGESAAYRESAKYLRAVLKPKDEK